jgi:transcriptional regulator with PAS, ATPase and Fis domain
MSLRDQTTQATEAAVDSGSNKRGAGRLIVVSSPDRALDSAVFQLPPDDYFLVGRALDKDGLSLADSRLSRLHFRIRWDGRSSGFRLGDAGSKNGTSVNGKHVTSLLLEIGDVIRAGDSLFVYDEGDPMRDTWERAERAAGTELNALLLGESGTGKEVLAKLLHDKSGRTGPFVAVNCAAVSRELIGAELFGHSRGAFSGAIKRRAGLFAAAAGGTLLLDEIGDLPLEVQAAVLRVLQERRMRPVGEDLDVPVTARVVAATHVDLEAARSSGQFREDLFARLAQVVLPVKPLRERRTEILKLAHQFSTRPLAIEPSAAQVLLLWRWPHNVRELKAMIDAFCMLEPTAAPLTLNYLLRGYPKLGDVLATRSSPASAPSSDSHGPGRERLAQLLTAHDGNITAVAKELGKVRPQVYRWLKAYGLSGRGPRRQE